MNRTFAKPVLSFACCAFLVACGGVPSSNELQFDNDGNGRFSGVAGDDWTASEIRSYASGQVCGNGPIGQFQVSVLPSAPEFTIFSGVCASGVESSAPAQTWQNRVVTAPTTAATSAAATQGTTWIGSSSTWDGSTPIVD